MTPLTPPPGRAAGWRAASQCAGSPPDWPSRASPPRNARRRWIPCARPRPTRILPPPAPLHGGAGSAPIAAAPAIVPASSAPSRAPALPGARRRWCWVAPIRTPSRHCSTPSDPDLLPLSRSRFALAHQLRHPLRIRVGAPLQRRDDARPVGRRAVLAHLELAVEPADRDLDPDD